MLWKVVNWQYFPFDSRRGGSLNQCCALESDDESWEISDLMAGTSECYENMGTSPSGNHYTSVAVVNTIGKASIITSE